MPLKRKAVLEKLLSMVSSIKSGLIWQNLVYLSKYGRQEKNKVQ
jgi:hypothetical protein